MYNLESYNFGELFRKARKSKGITVETLSKQLRKTPTTIYKYERNEILPDLMTVLEICNLLEVNFDDLASVKRVEESKMTSNNPFSVNKLYIYYLGFNNIAVFELEIKSENGFQTVYFKHIETGLIYFVGTLESSHDIAYINMKNYYVTNKKFEKVEIIINLKYASDNRFMGLVSGTNDESNIPTIKKCIITKKLIDTKDKKDIDSVKRRLQITNEELKDIKNKRFWDVDITNKTDYTVVRSEE